MVLSVSLMRTIHYRLAWCTFVLLSMASCKKFVPEFSEADDLESEWLFPAVYTTVDFQTLKEVENQTFVIQVPSIDIGYASNIPFEVPPITLAQVGPYVVPISNFFERIQFNLLSVNVSLQNKFPLTIEAGTRVAFRNSAGTADDSNLIYRYALQSDVPPDGAISIETEVLSNFISDTLYVWLENFQSPGGSNLSFSSLPSTIQVQFKVIDLDYVEMTEQSTFNTEQALAINVDAEVDTTSANAVGTAYVYLDNAMPLDQTVQVYFLNAADQVIDSLFTSPATALAAAVDPQGNPLEVRSSRAEAPISYERWQRITDSNRAVIRYGLATGIGTDGVVRAASTTYLNAQLVFNVRLSVGFN